jgi:hypothetical protein
MLVFLGVAREAAERGQAKVLVLDDVLQSVDAAIRLRTIDYILKTFSDWQFVITVHDRLWKEQLRSVMNRHAHRFVDAEISRWSFEQGPLIIQGVSAANPLNRALANGNAQEICAAAGYALEELSELMSYRLPISVTRRKGDRYTLGDLWPGVLKSLRKSDLASLAEDVDRWVHLRNVYGAHFNEWAKSLSDQEAREFGKAVESLVQSLHCSTCEGWVEELRLASGASHGWACRCGRKTVSRATRQAST